jgi:hypothetical protein
MAASESANVPRDRGALLFFLAHLPELQYSQMKRNHFALSESFQEEY